MKANHLFSALLLLTSLGLSAEEQKSPAGKTKEQEAAYEKAVQQCNAQTNAGKQKCIEKAKERHGEMLK